MSWKLTYDAPVGLRTNRGFWGVTVMGNNWFSELTGKWSESIVGPCSNYDHQPKTTKAFLRYLRKHPELKGHVVWFSHNSFLSAGGVITSLNIKAEWVE